MAYLNDDYKGGATRFQEEAAGAETRGAAGSLLVFNHDVQHEGLPVKSGRKYIMRTDGTWGPFGRCVHLPAGSRCRYLRYVR